MFFIGVFPIVYAIGYIERVCYAILGIPIGLFRVRGVFFIFFVGIDVIDVMV